MDRGSETERKLKVNIFQLYLVVIAAMFCYELEDEILYIISIVLLALLLIRTFLICERIVMEVYGIPLYEFLTISFLRGLASQDEVSEEEDDSKWVLDVDDRSIKGPEGTVNVMTDGQILQALIAMAESSEDEEWADQTLRGNKQRVFELYQTDATIANLVHQVIRNKHQAHSFCITMSSIKGLWKEKGVQIAFVEALQQGDTLLIDGISFIPEYAKLPLIQEAIAYNIATCESMFFQAMIANGLGLREVPQIKQAILDRKRTIIATIRENWRTAAVIASIPYLMEDADIKQTIKDAKEHIIRDIGERDSLIDATWLMSHLEWLRDDPAVVKAMERRILDKHARFDRVSMKTLNEAGMFKDYPEIMYALGTHGENVRESILDL